MGDPVRFLFFVVVCCVMWMEASALCDIFGDAFPLFVKGRGPNSDGRPGVVVLMPSERLTARGWRLCDPPRLEQRTPVLRVALLFFCFSPWHHLSIPPRIATTTRVFRQLRDSSTTNPSKKVVFAMLPWRRLYAERVCSLKLLNQLSPKMLIEYDADSESVRTTRLLRL